MGFRHSEDVHKQRVHTFTYNPQAPTTTKRVRSHKGRNLRKTEGGQHLVTKLETLKEHPEQTRQFTTNKRNAQRPNTTLLPFSSLQSRFLLDHHGNTGVRCALESIGCSVLLFGQLGVEGAYWRSFVVGIVRERANVGIRSFGLRMESMYRGSLMWVVLRMVSRCR